MCVCLVTQWCLTLYDPMDCSPPGSSVHGNSPGRNTRVDCHALLQGIFLTQGSNPGLLHYRQIIYCLSHQGSPRILEWGSPSLPQGIFLTQELNQGLLRCRQILYQLGYQGSPCWVILIINPQFINYFLDFFGFLVYFCYYQKKKKVSFYTVERRFVG